MDTPLINWPQLEDLVGDPADTEQMEAVALMWGDMCVSVGATLGEIDAQTEAAEVRHQLHSMRGLVLTWGFARLGATLHAIERSADPVGAWSSEKESARGMFTATMSEILERYPGLSAGQTG